METRGCQFAAQKISRRQEGEEFVSNSVYVKGSLRGEKVEIENNSEHKTNKSQKSPKQKK